MFPIVKTERIEKVLLIFYSKRMLLLLLLDAVDLSSALTNWRQLLGLSSANELKKIDKVWRFVVCPSSRNADILDERRPLFVHDLVIH